MPFVCFLQLKRTASVPSEPVLKALCLDQRKGPFFVFEDDDQFAEHHTIGIRNAIQARGNFAEKVHVRYTMNEEDEKIYLTQDRKFRFNGKLLKERQIASNKASGKKEFEF